MVNSLPVSLDAVFAALSDPTRRSILRRLGRGPRTTSELAAPFDMSLPGVLKHLRVLERAGLVLGERQGRERYYRLRATPLGEADAWLEQYRDFWETQLDALNTYMEESHRD
jgi:DNA-binding transcriptional ArsR family regulator